MIMVYYSNKLNKMFLISTNWNTCVVQSGEFTKTFSTIHELYEYGTKNELEYIGTLN